jgi:hypothetical protein
MLWMTVSVEVFTTETELTSWFDMKLLLGHSRIQMVLRYAHPTQQHQAQAMRKLEEFNAARQTAEYEAASADPLQVASSKFDVVQVDESVGGAGRNRTDV